MEFLQNKFERIDQYLNDHPKVKFILPQALLLVFLFSIISTFHLMQAQIWLHEELILVLVF